MAEGKISADGALSKLESFIDRLEVLNNQLEKQEKELEGTSSKLKKTKVGVSVDESSLKKLDSFTKRLSESFKKISDTDFKISLEKGKRKNDIAKQLEKYIPGVSDAENYLKSKQASLVTAIQDYYSSIDSIKQRYVDYNKSPNSSKLSDNLFTPDILSFDKSAVDKSYQEYFKSIEKNEADFTEQQLEIIKRREELYDAYIKARDKFNSKKTELNGDYSDLDKNRELLQAGSDMVNIAKQMSECTKELGQTEYKDVDFSKVFKNMGNFADQLKKSGALGAFEEEAENLNKTIDKFIDIGKRISEGIANSGIVNFGEMADFIKPFLEQSKNDAKQAQDVVKQAQTINEELKKAETYVDENKKILSSLTGSKSNPKKEGQSSVYSKFNELTKSKNDALRNKLKWSPTISSGAATALEYQYVGEITNLLKNTGDTIRYNKNSKDKDIDGVLKGGFEYYDKLIAEKPELESLKNAILGVKTATEETQKVTQNATSGSSSTKDITGISNVSIEKTNKLTEAKGKLNDEFERAKQLGTDTSGFVATDDSDVQNLKESAEALNKFNNEQERSVKLGAGVAVSGQATTTTSIPKEAQNLIDEIKKLDSLKKSLDYERENKSTIQSFNQNFQDVHVVLSKYKQTIEEINKLRLEPETDETKKKIQELLVLCGKFDSKFKELGYLNDSTPNDLKKLFGYSNEDLNLLYGNDYNYNSIYKQIIDQINSNYKKLQNEFPDIFNKYLDGSIKINGDGIDPFSRITEELGRIETKGKETFDSINVELMDSTDYVNQLERRLNEIIKGNTGRGKFGDEVKVSLRHSPELEPFKDATEFDNTKWLDFLATLPQAQEYLKSIGYEFKNIETVKNSVTLPLNEETTENTDKIVSGWQEVKNIIDSADRSFLEFIATGNELYSKDGVINFADEEAGVKRIVDELKEIYTHRKENNFEQVYGNEVINLIDSLNGAGYGTSELNNKTMEAFFNNVNRFKEARKALKEAAKYNINDEMSSIYNDPDLDSVDKIIEYVNKMVAAQEQVEEFKKVFSNKDSATSNLYSGVEEVGRLYDNLVEKISNGSITAKEAVEQLNQAIEKEVKFSPEFIKRQEEKKASSNNAVLTNSESNSEQVNQNLKERISLLQEIASSYDKYASIDDQLYETEPDTKKYDKLQEQLDLAGEKVDEFESKYTQAIVELNDGSKINIPLDEEFSETVNNILADASKIKDITMVSPELQKAIDGYKILDKIIDRNTKKDGTISENTSHAFNEIKSCKEEINRLETTINNIKTQDPSGMFGDLSKLEQAENLLSRLKERLIELPREKEFDKLTEGLFDDLTDDEWTNISGKFDEVFDKVKTGAISAKDGVEELVKEINLMKGQSSTLPLTQEVQELTQEEIECAEKAKEIGQAFGITNKNALKEIQDVLLDYKQSSKNSLQTDENGFLIGGIDDELDIFANAGTSIDDVLNTISKHIKSSKTEIEGYIDTWKQVREYVSNSKIDISDGVKSEFGDNYQSLLSTIGRKNITTDGSGSDIITFLSEINGQLGTTFDLTVSNQDAFRELYNFLKNKPLDIDISTLPESIRNAVNQILDGTYGQEINRKYKASSPKIKSAKFSNQDTNQDIISDLKQEEQASTESTGVVVTNEEKKQQAYKETAQAAQRSKEEVKSFENEIKQLWNDSNIAFGIARGGEDFKELDSYKNILEKYSNGEITKSDAIAQLQLDWERAQKSMNEYCKLMNKYSSENGFSGRGKLQRFSESVGFENIEKLKSDLKQGVISIDEFEQKLKELLSAKKSTDTSGTQEEIVNQNELQQEYRETAESAKEASDAIRNVESATSDGRKIIGTVDNGSTRSRTYQDKIGRTYVENEVFNTDVGEWQLSSTKTLTNYVQLEKDAVKYTNQLALAYADLEKEQRKATPDTLVLDTINEQILLLESRIEDVKAQAKSYDDEHGLGEEYSYDLFNERVSQQTDEYAAKLAVKNAQEIRKENEANLKVIQQENKALDSSNSFLSKQSIELKKIQHSYDANFNAKKSIVGNDKVKEADQKELTDLYEKIRQEISDYRNQQHTLTSGERDTLKEEIEELKLKKVELQNKYYGSTTLSPTELTDSKSIIKSNYDLLISKCKEAGTYTKELVGRLEEQRKAIDNIDNSNGIKEYTDHLKAARAEFAKLSQDEKARTSKEKANNKAYQEKYDIIKQYSQAQDELNNLLGKEVKQGSSNELTVKIDAQKKKVEELESKAKEAAKAITLMYEAGSISLDKVKEPYDIYLNTKKGKTDSFNVLSGIKDDKTQTENAKEEASNVEYVSQAYKDLESSLVAVIEKENQLNQLRQDGATSKQIDKAQRNLQSTLDQLESNKALVDDLALLGEIDTKSPDYINYSSQYGAAVDSAKQSMYNAEVYKEDLARLKQIEKEKAEAEKASGKGTSSTKGVVTLESAYKNLTKTYKEYLSLEEKKKAGTATDEQLTRLRELIAERERYNKIVESQEATTEKEKFAKQDYDTLLAKEEELRKKSAAYEANIKSALSNTSSIMSKFSTSNMDGFDRVFANAEQKVDALNESLQTGKISLETYSKRIKDIASDLGNVLKVTDTGLNTEQAEAELKSYANTLKNVQIGKFNADNNTLKIKFEEQAGVIKEVTLKYDELTGAIKRAKEASGKSESGIQSFISGLKKRFESLSQYLLTFVSFYEVVNVVKQGITVVRDLDTAFTEMRKVSDESVESLKNFQSASFDIASTVGTTAKQIQNSTADWMRLGESLDEASESAEVANVLLNVSEFESIDEATESLVAMSAAYDELDKMEIVDKMNLIGNNFAISTDGLATALQKSASALKTAGNDMDEAIALVTAGNQVVQNPDSVGAGLRTIALRITGTEAAKEELEELGEDTSDFVVQTSAKSQQAIKDFTKVASNNFQGFDILDENGNFKSTYEILLGIAEIYDEIVETDKQYGSNMANGLLEALAGSGNCQKNMETYFYRTHLIARNA